MSSLFTTSDNVKAKLPFGKFAHIPFYLQFVPGVCVNPITSTRTLNSYNDASNVNSIMAIPHVREKIKKKMTNLNDDDRYFPLFRGMFEVPAHGDPVLLCTIGGIQYYLGPLNTQNNVNFNMDNLFEPEIPLRATGKQRVEPNEKTHTGESLNFQKSDFSRLIKSWNPKLDSTTSFNETHGDIMLEGRHGNSIRVGSRNINPYIFISNGRQETFNKEGFADGTLIAITNKGSLNQHFGGYARQTNPNNIEGELELVNGFTLASDYLYTGETQLNRLMSSLISNVNNDENIVDLIYNYGIEENQNQVLVNSDRITINSKSDDIFLSSNKDIHMGTKRHLTISTNGAGIALVYYDSDNGWLLKYND